MAKRFGFNQIFRDGRHIECDKRRFWRVDMAVKRMGDQFFTGPDSPLISTLIERDSRPIMQNTSCMAGASPIMSVVRAR